MLAFLIVLGIILYIIVGVIVFVIFSRIDFFDEYTSDFRFMEFPTSTFLCSVFLDNNSSYVLNRSYM